MHYKLNDNKAIGYDKTEARDGVNENTVEREHMTRYYNSLFGLSSRWRLVKQRITVASTSAAMRIKLQVNKMH